MRRREQIAPLHIDSDYRDEYDAKYDDARESDAYETDDPSDDDVDSDVVIDDSQDDQDQNSEPELWEGEGEADNDLTGVQHNGKEQDEASADEEADHIMCYTTLKSAVIQSLKVFANY